MNQQQIDSLTRRLDLIDLGILRVTLAEEARLRRTLRAAQRAN